MEKWPRNVSFYIFLTGARLNNLILENIMGLKILKRKYACGSSFVMITWKPLFLKISTTLRVMSLGSNFCRNYQRTKGCKNLRQTCWSKFALLMFSVCSISLVASVMLSIHAKLFSHVLTIQDRGWQQTSTELCWLQQDYNFYWQESWTWFVDIFFMIVRCEGVENYMFHKDSQLV